MQIHSLVTDLDGDPFRYNLVDVGYYSLRPLRACEIHWLRLASRAEFHWYLKQGGLGNVALTPNHANELADGAPATYPLDSIWSTYSDSVIVYKVKAVEGSLLLCDIYDSVGLQSEYVRHTDLQLKRRQDDGLWRRVALRGCTRRAA